MIKKKENLEKLELPKCSDWYLQQKVNNSDVMIMCDKCKRTDLQYYYKHKELVEYDLCPECYELATGTYLDNITDKIKMMQDDNIDLISAGLISMMMTSIYKKDHNTKSNCLDKNDRIDKIEKFLDKNIVDVIPKMRTSIYHKDHHTKSYCCQRFRCCPSPTCNIF